MTDKTEGSRILNLKTGVLLRVGGDRLISIMYPLTTRWVPYRRIVPTETPADWIAKHLSGKEWRLHGKQPTESQLASWATRAKVPATDGCLVLPDGQCSHGYPSWLVVAGIVELDASDDEVSEKRTSGGDTSKT